MGKTKIKLRKMKKLVKRMERESLRQAEEMKEFVRDLEDMACGSPYRRL